MAVRSDGQWDTTHSVHPSAQRPPQGTRLSVQRQHARGLQALGKRVRYTTSTDLPSVSIRAYAFSSYAP